MPAWIKVSITAAATGVVGLLGGWDKAVQGLLLFIALDYAAGLLLALSQGRFNSTVGVKGIARKVGELVALIGATGVDRYVSDANPWARTATAVALTLIEAGSFFANLAAAGVPLPQFLTNWLNDEIQRKVPKAAPIPSPTDPVQGVSSNGG